MPGWTYELGQEHTPSFPRCLAHSLPRCLVPSYDLSQEHDVWVRAKLEAAELKGCMFFCMHPSEGIYFYSKECALTEHLKECALTGHLTELCEGWETHEAASAIISGGRDGMVKGWSMPFEGDQPGKKVNPLWELDVDLELVKQLGESRSLASWLFHASLHRRTQGPSAPCGSR